jgi:hypothetical protein
MLSLKKRSDSESVEAPHWHPNYRNFERLPDTKVVRTTFFINTAAVAIAAGLLIWLGNREYVLYTLNTQIEQAQQEIDGNSRENKEAIRLSGLFAEEQKKLAELEAFMTRTVTPLEFVGALGRTLPKEVAIDSIDARLTDPNGVSFSVRGRIAGSRDQATGTASNYVEQLKADAQIGRLFEPITLLNINPDPQSGLMFFEIVFKGRPPAKGKK